MAASFVNDIDRIIKALTEGLSQRQIDVLTRRFSLKGGNRLTLAAIGKEFNITRERVRQIEAAALKALRSKATVAAKQILDEARTHLVRWGGVRRHDFLVSDLSGNLPKNKAEVLSSKLHFIFLAAGEPQLAKEDDNWEHFWHLDDSYKKKAIAFVKELENELEANKVKLLNQEYALGHSSDPVKANFASLYKSFGQNTFGDFGLRHWSEISPKTVCDKAYLVLKKHQKPLHFRQLAEKINSLKIDRKKVNVQTVHNELIKDNRFVLVGRGIYGLKEFGFEPGTAREVIASLLKSKGPLHSHQVVSLVKEKRFFKENTILLNLQNRRYFKKLSDGRYTAQS